MQLVVIANGFNENKVCYLESNLVILHSVTKENILRSVVELHNWMFYKRWLPLAEENVKKWFYPIERGQFLKLNVEDLGDNEGRLCINFAQSNFYENLGVT